MDYLLLEELEDYRLAGESQNCLRSMNPSQRVAFLLVPLFRALEGFHFSLARSESGEILPEELCWPVRVGRSGA